MSISARKIVLIAALVIMMTALLWAGSGDRAARLQAEPAPAPVTIASAVSTPMVQPEPAEPQAAMAAVPLSQVRLVRQSLKRSGLGARVLATVTVRNRHQYAIKDVEILCAFRGRDGYVTTRRRVLPEVIEARSRETFANVLVGHINVVTTRGRCKLVGASRV